MPWDKESIKKHNHKLHGKSAEKAASQANAILDKTGDEGLALAVANKDAKKKRKLKDHEVLYEKD